MFIFLYIDSLKIKWWILVSYMTNIGHHIGIIASIKSDSDMIFNGKGMIENLKSFV